MVTFFYKFLLNYKMIVEFCIIPIIKCDQFWENVPKRIIRRNTCSGFDNIAPSSALT